MPPQTAPAWQVASWLNADQPLTLEALRGKVVLLHAFQMLCPGCVTHGIPQAQRVAALFAGAPLAVVGLHAVFEHHAVTGVEALRAFVHEYRITHPVGVDQPGPAGDPVPCTMRAYRMQGTPTVVLIDAEGRIRRQSFGPVDDLVLGADIGALLVEASHAGSAPVSGAVAEGGCDTAGCSMPD